MVVSDLLDHTRNNVLRDFRKPNLFPDPLVLGFLTEAQNIVATRTHTFLSAYREISLTAGEDEYPLDDDIVFVYSVRLDGYPGRLSVSTENWTPDNTSESRPTRYTVDKETQAIRFYVCPEAGYTAVLRVARLPVSMTEDTLDDDVELKEQYQLCLPDWAAYRCLSLNDVDGMENQAAMLAKKRFDDAVNEIKFNEYRLKMSSNNHVRGRRVK